VNSRRAALTAIAVGIVALVAGIYGVVGPGVSILLACVGLFLMLSGACFLAWIARPWHLSSPHPYVIAIALAAGVLHGYEYFYRSSGGALFGFLLWSMVPYGLCLVLSSFPATRVAVIVGAGLALAFDAFGHYSVFVNPKGSTSALVLLFIPLWSTIVVVPVATFIALLVVQKRRANGP
jgi:hypothetical protein